MHMASQINFKFHDDLAIAHHPRKLKETALQNHKFWFDSSFSVEYNGEGYYYSEGL